MKKPYEIEAQCVELRARINTLLKKLDKLEKMDDELQRCKLGLRCKWQEVSRELTKLELEMSK